MKYINRNIEKKIDEMKGNFPVILVTGARQSGKSTLLEYINNSSKETINYVDAYLIGVKGRIQTDSYEQDGETKYSTSIIAEKITFLSSSKAKDGDELEA